jgi:hypothetical protein|tara:strand:+ start:322 stop:1482 length:1161 start_codon:yes stop_codon:yes gene_type:complete
MALVLKDRVKETTATTGTGAISLGGAVANFQAFSAVLSNADTTYYAIVDTTNTAFEVGLGTYASSGNTLTRTTVLESSNSGSAVDFGAGSKSIFIAYPGEKSAYLDASNQLVINGTAVTSTPAELNILDGVTSTTAELNILDGVTSTATELNFLDGSTADTVVNSKAVIYGAAGQIIASELDVDNIQVDSNAVKSTDTNGNIQLFPNGTGFTELYGNTNPGTVRFNCESNSHGVTVKGPAHSAAATYTVNLPDTLGLTQASGIVTSDANGVVTFDNGTIDESTTITSSSNAATLNLRDGNSFLHDLTENVTYTFSNPAASGKASMFVLKVIQDSSARTITWPGSVDWAAATAPTLTATNNGVDVFVFFTIDGGTTYYGFTAGQAMG